MASPALGLGPQNNKIEWDFYLAWKLVARAKAEAYIPHILTEKNAKAPLKIGTNHLLTSAITPVLNPIYIDQRHLARGRSEGGR